MTSFHHFKLPAHSTLLAGRAPRDGLGFPSSALQIWYNNTEKNWVSAGEPLHYHVGSDECFVVLRGRLDVQVDGAIHAVSAGEYCCFPAGQPHGIALVHPPVETLMIRAPSVADKVILDGAGVIVEAWDVQNSRWSELQALIDEAGQTDWASFTAAWHASSCVLAALVGGEVAGFLRYVIQPIGPDMDCEPLRLGGHLLREAKVLAFAVAERFRGQGIGRRLQIEAIARARAAGCHQVRSRSANSHAANHRLKLSLGFAAHPVKDARGEGVYFVLPLSPA